VKVKQPSRQTLSNWEYGAECFLADLTDQVDIPGLEDDSKLKQSKLTSEETKRMLHELAEALQMDWPEFVSLLDKAWRVRRRKKAKRLGWYEPGERMTRKKQESQKRSMPTA
jgi:hypothetical protein